MKSLQKKQLVLERFNKESGVWNDVHSGAAGDVIQWEVAKRKALTIKFLQSQFRDRPAAILEIGCGAGRNLEEIVHCNPLWIGKGVDIAKAMIDSCRVRYQAEERLTFEVLDIDDAYLKEKFDAVLLLGVVGYLGSNYRAFQNIERMLRPGGFVVLTFGKRYSISRLFRRTYRFSRRCAYFALEKLLRPQSVTQDHSEQSLFRCFSLREIRLCFPRRWRLLGRFNLAFGAGMLGRKSASISKAFERVFSRHDPLGLALTSLIVVVDSGGQETFTPVQRPRITPGTS